MKYLFYFAILLLLPFNIRAQDASATIERLEEKMNRIENYSADVYIKSDIPLIKILPVRATVYFKQKDKFRIVSKGIAILPRQGFTDVSKILGDKDNYTILHTGYESISNTKAEVITILPAQDTIDLILAKLWIDETKNIVLKSQITTRTNGTVLIEYFHQTDNSFGLPDSMIFTVDVKKFKIPKGVATDINHTSSEDEKKPPAKSGKIFLRMSNYKINKGVSDDIFKK